MKTNKAPKSNPSEIDHAHPVELIAGPECGRFVEWPRGESEASVRYQGGVATYRFEGNQKAIYVEG